MKLLSAFLLLYFIGVEAREPTKRQEVFSLIDTHPTLKYKVWVKRQFVDESANGKSELCTKHNNCFGMKYTPNGLADYKVTVKPYRGYAGYKSIKTGVADYSRLQTFWITKYRITTEAVYLTILDKKYPDTRIKQKETYTHKLSKITV